MEGPKAPKDPEKKLPGFYIVREKEIFGTEQPFSTNPSYLKKPSTARFTATLNTRLFRAAFLSPRFLEILQMREYWKH